jgi:hypothetical protein
MTEHCHDWKPIDGRMGQYHCACGRTGFRGRHGLIVEHKAVNKIVAKPTVREGAPRAFRESEWEAPKDRE